MEKIELIVAHFILIFVRRDFWIGWELTATEEFHIGL